MKKDMLKAVRMVNGFNADLRVKLPYNPNAYTPAQLTIRNFLHDHILDIYGSNIYSTLGVTFNPQPGKDAFNHSKVIDFLDRESKNVCLGIYDQ